MTIFASPSFDERLFDLYMLEDKAAGYNTDCVPIYPYDSVVMTGANMMVGAYVTLSSDLGLAVFPDQLPYLGAAGAWIHRVTCRRKDACAAFRRFVARRVAGIPYPTSLKEGVHTLASRAERLTLRWIAPLPGISHIDVHPPLAGSALSADLKLTAVNDRSAYVEVVGMLVSATSVGRDEHCERYRARLLTKLETYRALGLEPPVLVFVADLTPTGLTIKGHEILARLGLPSSLPGWSERGLEEVTL